MTTPAWMIPEAAHDRSERLSVDTETTVALLPYNGVRAWTDYNASKRT